MQIFCIINIFDAYQNIEIKYNNQSQKIKVDYNNLTNKIVELASTISNSKVYISGLPENNLFVLKEEILNKSQIEYSNNNIEVIII